MTFDIERQFLVISDAWRKDVVRRRFLRDGLIASTDGRKARVRIIDTRATLAIKTKRDGFFREEFEYEIPLADAERMLAVCCGGNVLEKWRSEIRHQGLTWEVDEYIGVLAGVILAEVEVEDESQTISKPHWVGPEVTADPAWTKLNLLQTRREAAAAAGVPPLFGLGNH
jgi:CYTH domain-containing protein